MCCPVLLALWCLGKALSHGARALIIKARFGLTDEKLVEQIEENPHLQFFIGLSGFQYSAPFVPSMMIYFLKQLPESVVNDCNERIVLHSLCVIRSYASNDHVDDSSHGGGSISADDQQVGSDKASPNQGSLVIDATCVPADIRPQPVSHCSMKPES